MIYVTIGTMFLDFHRLVTAMDAIARDTDEQVVVQLGMSPARPRHCAWFDFLPREQCLELQRHARVIVGHAGIGTAIDALEAKRPFVVVPRLKRYGEHMNDHQLEIADAIELRGWGRKILDMADLADACATPPAAPTHYRPNREPLIAAVRAMVDRVARKDG